MVKLARSFKVRDFIKNDRTYHINRDTAFKIEGEGSLTFTLDPGRPLVNHATNFPTQFTQHRLRSHDRPPAARWPAGQAGPMGGAGCLLLAYDDGCQYDPAESQLT